jgi:methionyl-tRNA synthetase
MKNSPLILITPPPTPNGRLHIGHVAGPYLRADILARLNRRKGHRPVYHVSHLDTYQSYVPKKAAELGRGTDEFLKDTSSGIINDFRDFSIVHDFFLNNTSAEYIEFVDSGVRSLLGVQNARKESSYRCDDCQFVLSESQVKGYCPSCLHDAFQNVCENCCLPQQYERMVRPICQRCGGTSGTAHANLDSLWFDITEGDLALVRSACGDAVGADRRISALLRNIQEHGIALSYPFLYGLELPCLDGHGTINPWVEIFFAHVYEVLRVLGIDISGGFDEAAEALRAINGKPEVVAFFGIDNSYYYTVLFTLFALKLNLREVLPANFKPSYFMELNGSKISSSRNNVIWAAELLANSDVASLRTTLAASSPEFSNRAYAPARGRHITSTAGVPPTEAEDPNVGTLAALRAREHELVDPTNFSIEGVVNLIDKASGYAAAAAAAGDQRESQAIGEYVNALLHDLNFG